MLLLGENILCFKTNSKHGWLFLYWFAANNVADINFIKLRMLNLSVSYLLFAFQDTVIYDRLAETSKYKDITLKHLEQFATEGECNMAIKHDWNKKSWTTDIWQGHCYYFKIPKAR